jgi:hypothetical protein
LAKRFHAFEAVDKSEFQTAARTLQSIWREERGFAVGEWRGRPLGSQLEMPWAKDTLANYLTDTIRKVVRQEVLDKSKSRGKLFSSPRIFNNLLSSQPLCFNLFGELQQDLDLATAVFSDITSGRVQNVTSIEFEESPGRGDARYTGDNSAFDVYVTFKTPDGGNGFIGIEVKYYENLMESAATHRPRYDEVAEIMGCFEALKLTSLKSQPLQQIWRDHLLVGALSHVGAYDDGFFAFLYPRGNLNCAGAVAQYRACLTNLNSFDDWTLEDLTSCIKRHTTEDWIEKFHDRYLNFGKLVNYV